MVFRSSERAKKGTRTQIDGIISFLKKQLSNQEKELAKFSAYGSIGKKAVAVIEKNIASTTKSLDYYVGLREEYEDQGLI